MSNVLNKLDSDESILLMYLSGELSPQEQAGVEQRLAGDAQLRAALDELRAASASAGQAVARLDELTAPPIPDPVAIRQITRMVKQWQAAQFEKARLDYGQQRPERALRFPWWAYPLATAAAIVLALLVWWVNLDEFGQQDPIHQGPYVVNRGVWRFGPGAGGGDFGGMLLAPVWEEPSPLEELWADSLTTSLDNGDDLLEDALVGDPLDEAEQHLLALWDRRSDFPDALFTQPQQLETGNP